MITNHPMNLKNSTCSNVESKPLRVKLQRNHSPTTHKAAPQNHRSHARVLPISSSQVIHLPRHAQWRDTSTLQTFMRRCKLNLQRYINYAFVFQACTGCINDGSEKGETGEAAQWRRKVEAMNTLAGEGATVVAVMFTSVPSNDSEAWSRLEEGGWEGALMVVEVAPEHSHHPPERSHIHRGRPRPPCDEYTPFIQEIQRRCLFYTAVVGPTTSPPVALALPANCATAYVSEGVLGKENYPSVASSQPTQPVRSLPFPAQPQCPSARVPAAA